MNDLDKMSQARASKEIAESLVDVLKKEKRQG